MLNLSNVKIRTKLAMMLFLPIMGVIFFSASGMIDRNKVKGDMKTILLLSQFSVKSSNLIDETQKERGATAGFVGSKGKKFKSELTNQRLETDKKKNELKAFLNNADMNTLDNRFKSALNKSLQLLTEIERIRKSVSSFNISANKAIGYYTKLNGQFLNMISYIPHLCREGTIATHMSAYVNFLMAKERAGIERAVLANTFAADKFSEGMFQRFNELVITQNTYIDVFLTLTSKEENNFYKSKMKDKAVNETDRMRKVTFEKGEEGNFGVDPVHWFNMQTKKINLLKNVEDELSKNLNKHSEMLLGEAGNALLMFIIITSIIIAVAFILSILILRSITHPLKTALNAMNDIAEGEGDLTRRLNDSGKDEVAMLASGFNKFAGKIEDLIVDIILSAQNLSNSIEEIAKGNEALSSRTSQQASSLEEIASTVEETNATTKQNTNNAAEANKLSENSYQMAEEGGRISNEAVNGINEINDVSKKIGDITNVINEISFQTNLLALNAAVEAARAGEAGRGFAVVAGEIRNLAQRSGNAAKEIEELIKDTIEKIATGSGLVNKSGESLNEIIKGIGEVNRIVNEITAASKEQEQGIEQLNLAVTEMDNMTQHNASLVEQTASASEEMSGQAQDLIKLTQSFQVNKDRII